MIERLGPDRFKVRFAKVKRRRSLFGRIGPVVVDEFAVSQAVMAALKACEWKTSRGKPRVWNDYTLFLARADKDRLDPLEASLHRELSEDLYQLLVDLEALTIGDFVVHLRVDEGGDVAEGEGVLWVRHIPSGQAAAPEAGEVTIRLDRLQRFAAPEPTARQGAAVLRGPHGSHPLTEGARHGVGRSHPDADPLHLGVVPPSETKVNRRQAWVRLEGGRVEVGREAGPSNGVSVNGQPLAAGASVTVPLPAEVTLTNGLVRLNIEAC